MMLPPACKQKSASFKVRFKIGFLEMGRVYDFVATSEDTGASFKNMATHKICHKKCVPVHRKVVIYKTELDMRMCLSSHKFKNMRF
jgi:hypothetical protein